MKNYLLGFKEDGKEFYIAMYKRQANWEQFYLTNNKNEGCKFILSEDKKKEDILKYIVSGEDNLLELLEGKDLIVWEVL